MDSYEAGKHARNYAQEFGEQHSYVTPDFVPHGWVVLAIMAAYNKGYGDALEDVDAG